MKFLNEEKKRLKDCTDEEIALVVSAIRGGNTAYFDGIYNHWHNCQAVTFVDLNEIYRVNPAPMSVNWDHVGEKWNYIRVGYCSDMYLYTHKPKRTSHIGWRKSQGEAWRFNVHTFSSFIRGDLPWDQAICDRPGFQQH